MKEWRYVVLGDVPVRVTSKKLSSRYSEANEGVMRTVEL